VEWSKFKRGDIVRWKAYGQDFDFHYGLIIGLEEFSEYHHYQFPFDALEPGYDMMTGFGYVPLRYECINSVTVFSFSEQKQRIIYQSSLEVPYLLELVLYEFAEAEVVADLIGHNED
jgi:hypothetical protein